MPYDGPSWHIGNQRKARRRRPEPIQILWVALFAVASVVLFFVPTTQILWLWIPTSFLMLLGILTTKDGPGFLVLWDKYQHLNRRKNPALNTKQKYDPIKEGQSDELSEPERKRRRQQRRPPINTVPMEYHDSSSDSYIGVLYQPPRIADASMIVSPAFSGAMLATDEFYDQVDRISESLIEAARASIEPIGILQGFMKRPYDISRSRDWQQQNIHPKILASVPGTTWQEVIAGKTAEDVIADASKPLIRKLTAEEFLHKDMTERDTLKQKRSYDAYSYYGLTVPRPEDWPLGNRGVITGLLSQQQLNDAPIVRLTKLVEQGLIANGALGVQTLDLDGFHHHLRRSWDMNPNTIRSWNEGLNFTQEGQPFDPTYPWPPFDFFTGLDKKGLPFINYGDTIHRMYIITGLEKKQVRPREFQELFQPGYLGPADEVGYGAALFGETVLSSEEARAATRIIRFKKAFKRMSGADTRDFDESARDREEAQLLENERDAFDYGGSHGLNLNFYINLSVYGENDKARFDRLAKVDEQFRLIARTLRVNIRSIRSAPQMNRAFWTMFGGTGMM